MKWVLQRVSEVSVSVDQKVIAAIDRGLLVFMGVVQGDDEALMAPMAKKITSFRIFEDDQGKMNLSVKDICGKILLVSQFTLCGNAQKGTRPSFDRAEKPERARYLIDQFSELLRQEGVEVQTGEFGATMQVHLVNEGPVTFVL